MNRGQTLAGPLIPHSLDVKILDQHLLTSGIFSVESPPNHNALLYGAACDMTDSSIGLSDFVEVLERGRSRNETLNRNRVLLIVPVWIQTILRH